MSSNLPSISSGAASNFSPWVRPSSSIATEPITSYFPNRRVVHLALPVASDHIYHCNSSNEPRIEPPISSSLVSSLFHCGGSTSSASNPKQTVYIGPVYIGRQAELLKQMGYELPYSDSSSSDIPERLESQSIREASDFIYDIYDSLIRLHSLCRCEPWDSAPSDYRPSDIPERLVSQSMREKCEKLLQRIAYSLPSEVSYASPDILSRLPNVLFDLITKSLSSREIAHLSQTNSIACHRVSEIRARLTDLNLHDLQIDDTGFGFKLKQHPNLTGINLRAVPKITNTGIRYLAEAMIGKKMKKVLIGIDSYENFVPQKTWKMLIVNLDFSELEEIDLTCTSFKMDCPFAGKWIEKLRSGSKLKICQISYGVEKNAYDKETFDWLQKALLHFFPYIGHLEQMAVEKSPKLATTLAQALPLKQMILNKLSRLLLSEETTDGFYQDLLQNNINDQIFLKDISLTDLD